jgi:hypothetical protein
MKQTNVQTETDRVNGHTDNFEDLMRRQHQAQNQQVARTSPPPTGMPAIVTAAEHMHLMNQSHQNHMGEMAQFNHQSSMTINSVMMAVHQSMAQFDRHASPLSDSSYNVCFEYEEEA